MNYYLPIKTDLSGKTAIVTGGSGTLCSAMAWALASSGASVAIIGRNKEKLDNVVASMKKESLEVKGFSCDVTDKKQLINAYEEIKNTYGTCDILINGAGGNRPEAITKKEMLDVELSEDDYSFWDMDENSIKDVMDINYMGTLLPIQVFSRDMITKRSGNIINIASVSSLLPLSKVVAYGNAKSAIKSLTEWMAIHLGKSGVRCNAIAPGFYAAEQNHALLYNEDGTLTKRAGMIIDGTPMGRFGTPQDLIGAVLFLASDKSSGFVNGITLSVDGGFSVYSGV